MRKRIMVGLVITLTAFPMAAQNPSEPVQQRLNSAPKAFRAFFAKFRGAVEKNRKAEVVSMTRFPFKYAYDAGDEGTYSKAQFLKNFKSIIGDFFGEYKMERNPVFGRHDGRFVISTESASHLGFVRSGNSFKFVSYYAEP